MIIHKSYTSFVDIKIDCADVLHCCSLSLRRTSDW